MNKKALTGIIFTVFSAFTAFANISFSGRIAANTGLEVSAPSEGNVTTGFPLSFAGEGQLNFNDWGILRTGLTINCPDLFTGTIYDGQDAKIKFNELSFVMNKRAISMTHYFSVFMGTYEPFGSDIFFKRYFGTGNFSSMLLRSSTTMEEVPLLDCNGYGISYIGSISQTPIAFGFYLYGNNLEPDVPKINLDLRYAMGFDFITMDLRGGIAAPIMDNINGEKAALVIDTIYVHGGATLFLGNQYTHSLLFQSGISDVSFVKTKNSKKPDDDVVFFLLEPRIYTEGTKFRATFFSLSKDKVKEMEYIEDTLGAALTVFNDTIPCGNSFMTLGIHGVVSLPDKTISNCGSISNAENVKVNALVSPYLETPCFGGRLEIMFQAGAHDLTDKISMTYKLKMGFKKTF